MIPIITAAFTFIPLFLLIKTMSLYQNKNLFSVIQKLLGKYLGFFVCLLIFIINVFSISFDSRTYTTIIRTFYFNRTPIVIIYAILMGVCAYGAKKGNSAYRIGCLSYYLLCSTTLVSCVRIMYSRKQYSIPFPHLGSWKT